MIAILDLLNWLNRCLQTGLKQSSPLNQVQGSRCHGVGAAKVRISKVALGMPLPSTHMIQGVLCCQTNGTITPIWPYECQIMDTAGSKTTRRGLMELFSEICPMTFNNHLPVFSVERPSSHFFVQPTDFGCHTKELFSQSSEVVITIKVNFVRNSLPLHRFKYILGWSQPVHNLAITEMVLADGCGWELPQELLFLESPNATFRTLLGGGWHLLFVQFLLESNREGSDSCKANLHQDQ